MSTQTYIDHIQKAASDKEIPWNHADGLEVDFIRDVKLHLQDTIVLADFHNSKPPVLALVSNVLSHVDVAPDKYTRMHLHLHRLKKSGETYSPKVYRADEVHMSQFLPDEGLYEVGMGVVYLTRAPQRQWRISFRAGTYNAHPLTSIGDDEDSCLDIYEEESMGYRRLAPYFSAVTSTSIALALKQVCGGQRLGTVLSPEFCLISKDKHILMKCEEAELWYKRYKLGTLGKKGGVQLYDAVPAWLLNKVEYLLEVG